MSTLTESKLKGRVVRWFFPLLKVHSEQPGLQFPRSVWVAGVEAVVEKLVAVGWWGTTMSCEVS